MGKEIKKFLKKQGFTLVELIIVIAIISILAVSAFMVLTKWLSNSRDSRRLADLGTIKKALEIDYTTLGYYPDPDDKEEVKDQNGNTMWYVGHVGEDVIKKIDSLIIVPVDPSDGSSFNYAITLNKQEYQVGVLLERGETASNLSNNVYAIQRQFTQNDIGSLNSDIDGRYDGFVGYSTGGVSYIVRSESLLVYSGNTLDTSGANYNLMGDDRLLGDEIILRDLDIPDGTPNDIIIVRARRELELTGGNIEGDKQAISIVENETTLDLVPIQYEHCELDGTLIAHGDSINTYSSSTVPFDNSCEDIQTSRLCDDGTLSAGPDIQNCSMEGAVDCTLDGSNVAHGDSINAYSETNILWNASYDCSDRLESRTCYNGNFDKDNSYQYVTCAKGTPENCNANTAYNYNGHIYNVSQLDHGETDTPTVDISETNGTYRYTLSATCNDGIYNESETGPVLVTCDTHYTANGNNCDADSKTTTCGGSLIANSEWNTSNDYIQTWNGSAWAPSKTANYNVNPSIDDCRYRCNTNYSWNGSACVANTRTTACGGSIVSNATASGAITYTQTWNGSAWTPSTNWGEDQATCDFNCNTNYNWNGSACVANGRTVTCNGTIPSNAEWNDSNDYSQTWNGSAWAPSKTANYDTVSSTDDCRYKCVSNYHTENGGASCVSNTKSCSITNGTGSQDWNGTAWGTCTVVSCDANYSESGNSCVANTRTTACGGSLPSNAGWNNSNDYSQTWNGSAWAPSKTANYNTVSSTNDCRYKCNTNYHTENGGTSCVSDTRSCSITNGTGTQNWNGTNWNSCVLSSCNSGYYANGNSCLAYTYSRLVGSRGACNESCGGGNKRRTVVCKRNDDTTMADSYCSSKPATMTTCNTQSCYTYSKVRYGRGACNKSCGGGTKRKYTRCRRSDGARVSDSYCGARSRASASCNTACCSSARSHGNNGTASCSTICARGHGRCVGSSYGSCGQAYGTCYCRKCN